MQRWIVNSTFLPNATVGSYVGSFSFHSSVKLGVINTNCSRVLCLWLWPCIELWPIKNVIYTYQLLSYCIWTRKSFSFLISFKSNTLLRSLGQSYSENDPWDLSSDPMRAQTHTYCKSPALKCIVVLLHCWCLFIFLPNAKVILSSFICNFTVIGKVAVVLNESCSCPSQWFLT